MCHFANLSSHYQADKYNKYFKLKQTLHLLGNSILKKIAHFYFKKYENECKKYNNIPTKKISLYCWGYKYKKFHRDRIDHLETIMMDFEFIKVPVCKNYDHALTQVFGDWHEYVIGGSIHNQIFFDPEKSYTHYLDTSSNS
jgi:lipopolysaccharide cholinephosphotransferase